MRKLHSQPEAWGILLPTSTQRDVTCRLLILSDWQGGHSNYIRRMAMLFSDALQSETVIFHPYEQRQLPTNYDFDGHKRVASRLADALTTRQWMADCLAALEPYWQHPKVPLILVGFCLGGSLAFEAARHCDLARVAISIHGNPLSDLGQISKHQTTMVYVSGGNDPLIPAQATAHFIQEMGHSQRDWFHFTLGKARHSFSKQEVGDQGPGSIYDPRLFAVARQHIALLIQNLIQPTVTGTQEGLRYV
jgi:dienelactone hydrolase